MAEGTILTESGLKKLEEELDYLISVRRKEISEKIAVARGFGDLSENSEYDEAKTEQGKLYSKIAELQNLIENAEIVEMTAMAGRVGHGSLVKVRDANGAVMQYSVVGSQEANPMEGLISSDSPFGRCLMGHGVGETVTVEAPAGQYRYEILEIEN